MRISKKKSWLNSKDHLSNSFTANISASRSIYKIFLQKQYYSYLKMNKKRKIFEASEIDANNLSSKIRRNSKYDNMKGN